MTNNLRPCPFCGGSDVDFTWLEDTGPDRGYGLAVLCNSCGGCMVTGLPEDWENPEPGRVKATEMWNARPSPLQVEEPLRVTPINGEQVEVPVATMTPEEFYRKIKG